jgi:hypothetical protein
MSSKCEVCGQSQDYDAYLCGLCALQARQQLAAFPYLYRDLAQELVPLGSNWPQGTGRGTVVDAPMPLVEKPMVLRANGGIVGVLEDWRAALHNDRGWTAPALPAGIEPRIRAAVDALTGNLLWIAAHWPEAGTFAQEVHDLYRDVTSITTPVERPRVQGGADPAAGREDHQVRLVRCGVSTGAVDVAAVGAG